MKKKLFGYLNTNRRGLALITVLGVVTLATILVLALFSVSDAEFKASKSYLEGSRARVMADNAVNLVISQIQSAATGKNVTTPGPTIWASQPGAVRVYSANGTFQMGRKLYSSANMVIAAPGPGGESALSTETPPNNWDAMPAAWVDINEPINVLSPAGGLQTFFPIVDPKAAVSVADPNGGTLQAIEGFSFQTGLAKVPPLASVAGMADGDPSLRLPMPVQWLYMLQDGSLGTVNVGGGGAGAPGNWAAVAGSGAPSENNPIVGRMAFWTDDESCKININTAAEPGAFDNPRMFHERDKNWADSPPVAYEYQRWPGHPATVALSSVLAPNARQETGRYDGDTFPMFPVQYLELKNAIYDLAPKIGAGGSADGTLVFAEDEWKNNVTADAETLFRQRVTSLTERRYASVDEMIFKSNMNGRTRVANDVMGFGSRLVTPTVLERARFFLSANSRAPETNMFGLPRVAIWPVPDKPLGPNFRTPYDEAIAFSATLGNPNTSTNTYYFSRRDYASGITDIGGDVTMPGSGLQRNFQLMSYLDKMMHQVMPGPAGASFFTKYGRDQRQILVQIFDYVRCTNLYDSFLDDRYVAEKGGRDKLDDNGQAVANQVGAKYIPGDVDLWKQRPAQYTYYTYTPPRFNTIRRLGDLQISVPAAYTSQWEDEEVTTGAYPGHGQVRPIEWTIDGETYKGLGRLPTISEVALHFICTGDGKPDEGSYQIRRGADTIKSGGKTAQKIDTATPNVRKPLVDDIRRPNAMWFSNIPPFPGRKFFEDAGCDFGRIRTGAANDPLVHPAANSPSWNGTLDWNGVDGGIALREDEKRIQIAMELELFVPAAGYTKYTPDFTIVLDGRQLGNLQVRDVTGAWRSIFNTTGDQVVQSTSAYMGARLGEHGGNNAVNPMGGHYGARPLMAGRQVRVPGKMPKDPSYQDAATGDVHGAMLNFPLVSGYFTVKRNQVGGIKFRANGGAGIKADIYASHDWQGKEDKKNSTPAQSVMIKFPDGEQQTPEPWLVVYSTERRDYIDSNGNRYLREAVNAVRWWAFNFGGAVGRWEGSGKPGGTNGLDWSDVREVVGGGIGNPDGTGSGTWGRFRGERAASTQTQDPTNNGGANVTVAMGTIIYGYSNLADYSGTKSQDGDLVNADVYRPRGPGQMGEYGFYGTDAVRSLVPRHGDYRVLAGQRVVPASTWVPHRLWNTGSLFAHNLSGSTATSETGYDNGHDEGSTQEKADYRLVQNAWYPLHQVPDTPLTQEASRISNRSGDFDNGPGDMRDGAYINKPDDGNLSVGKFWAGQGSGTEGDNKFHKSRNAYFMSSFLQTPSSNAYFTPNRMISSPGVFGSLPTGVYGSPTGDANGVPWRTLLFRADVNGHYGAPGWSGGADPADHFVMDLFWMPVIEPYAISESYSTAGKINLNCQMVPFPHITRTTALHAALKGELVNAVSSQDTDPRKRGGPAANNTVVYKTFRDDSSLGQKPKPQREFWTNTDGMAWHRAINREPTIKQLLDRQKFSGVAAASGGLMRAASQVCELHLVPQPDAPPTRELPIQANSQLSLKSSMAAFWDQNDLTGDNSRESTYANLYQKVTTRSNTFRVYFRVQTLKKARSVAPNEIDETKDTITGEYRGSALIERYLDLLNAVPLTDYAAMGDPFTGQSLEHNYHYRVLEMKQFAP